ncbi:hypothetical protein AAE478_006584 [Parahypoxylon ruwenzoriense]
MASGQPNAEVMAVRDSTNAFMAMGSDAFPYPEGMLESKHSVVSMDGNTIDVHHFLPLSVQERRIAEAPQRAIIFLYGGGMISGSVQVTRGFIATLAEDTGTQVFAPQYRIAPEHPFPTAAEDVYSAIFWLQSNATNFNVDPARIVVFGQSAGGGIAAGVALMAQDRGLYPPLAAQVLRYPMLDDMTTMDETDPRRKHLTWTVEGNEIGWKAYLGGKNRSDRTDDNVSPYAAPARAKNLTGMPPTHIGVGSLDLFKDEDIAYAVGLAKSNVRAEFHLYPGGVHGFDADPSNEMGAEMRQNEARFIRKI